jgi:hypothetical protein
MGAIVKDSRGTRAAESVVLSDKQPHTGFVVSRGIDSGFSPAWLELPDGILINPTQEERHSAAF